MTDRDRDIDAAERALGTLPKVEESDQDRALRRVWDARLAPLLDDIEPVLPPTGLLERIERSLDNGAVLSELAMHRRKARTWRVVAGIATAVAAVLAVYVGLTTSVGDAPRYVAVVTSDADETVGLIIEIDTATGEATIIPVGLTPPAGQSYEMWHLPEGAERPVSIGLLPDDPIERPAFEAGLGDLFAISLEPQGGSPSGQPTLPVYHGRAVVIE